ncbi:hypothetical protein DPMN_034852 [Dreissena polymorpha]|uniref:Uncharacterized protein n=1 Tax=Dreissena polymorpha TaxID=45954 RepID=A0A9D4M8E9_DREPO|nr:hypothetical protein DPMN_034852 [Dreissena polymorpha]
MIIPGRPELAMLVRRIHQTYTDRQTDRPKNRPVHRANTRTGKPTDQNPDRSIERIHGQANRPTKNQTGPRANTIYPLSARPCRGGDWKYCPKDSLNPTRRAIERVLEHPYYTENNFESIPTILTHTSTT